MNDQWGAGAGHPCPAPGRRPRALALIDGEHYPAVVAHALRELSARYEFLAAVFLGGTEKVGRDPVAAGAEVYGLAVVGGPDPVTALEAAIDRYQPQVVVDVSDEPVVGYTTRFRLISHSLARNVAYEGSDFRFTPPRLDRLSTIPSVSVIGTAKRVGKTAISGYVARTLGSSLSETSNFTACGGSAGGGVVVVAMGRGGPPEPEVIDGGGVPLSSADLLAWSHKGRHAASDHIEDAVLSRVTTIGCRRCGGGLAGAPFVSNVAEGALLANTLGAGLVVFEGSGAAIPPVATDARLLVAGAHQPRDHVVGYLGTYRVLVSDVVVVTMAEPPMAEDAAVRALMAEIREIKPEVRVIPMVFRPRPVSSVHGQRVAVFSTAPTAQAPVLRRHLEEHHGCRVVAWSSNLSDRRALELDMRSPEVRAAEMYVTEIKAAAIEVVVEEANRRAVPVVFVDNEPREVAPAREGTLADTCRWLADLAKERFALYAGA